MTRRDFFIHLGTIVLGILIAIGLEQTVELIHHRRQLAEARQQLAAERDLNREILQKNLRSVATMQAQLDRDVSILNQHLASPSTPLSAPLDYSWFLYRTPDGAWQAVRASGSLSLMSPAELRSNTYRYELFDTLMNAFHGRRRHRPASAIRHTQPANHAGAPLRYLHRAGFACRRPALPWYGINQRSHRPRSYVFRAPFRNPR